MRCCTSFNSLVGKLLQEASRKVKESFEVLLRGETIRTPIEEQIVYNQLSGNEEGIWSLLLASGYLKVIDYDDMEHLNHGEEQMYEIAMDCKRNLSINELKKELTDKMIIRTKEEVSNIINEIIN